MSRWWNPEIGLNVWRMGDTLYTNIAKVRLSRVDVRISFSPPLNISPWIINIIPTYYGYLESFFFFYSCGQWVGVKKQLRKYFFASFLWNVTFVMADAPRLEDMITRTHDSLSCDLQWIKLCYLPCREMVEPLPVLAFPVLLSALPATRSFFDNWQSQCIGNRSAVADGI